MGPQPGDGQGCSEAQQDGRGQRSARAVEPEVGPEHDLDRGEQAEDEAGHQQPLRRGELSSADQDGPVDEPGAPPCSLHMWIVAAGDSAWASLARVTSAGGVTRRRGPEGLWGVTTAVGCLPMVARMDASIEVRGLRKRYGSTTAVDGLSFTVRPGQVTGFVGPNGAGKSTTLRIILGLDAPDEGTALVGGRRYQTLRTPLSHVGALLDATAVHPGRKACDHLLWMAQSNGFARQRVDEVLELVGLASAARRRAGGLSLGMLQRLGIAAALLGDAPMLLFDEPVNGLDPDGIRWIRGFLRSLAAEGRAVLVSSHLMGELEDTADHLVVIGRGRLIADTSVRDLLAAASRDQILLRTSRRSEAMTVLANAGATVTAGDRETLTVAGLPAERVVALLGERGLPVMEVAQHRASLEEAYMELTRDALDYEAVAVEAS